MGITFANSPCYSPEQAYDACVRRKLPVDWWGLPNSFRTTVGPTPARGWLLMKRRDVAAIGGTSGPNGTYDLTFSDKKNPPLTIKNLVFFRARCLTPGVKGDPQALYLVEVRDARHLALNEYYGAVINKQYNVRAPAGATTYYYDASYGGTGTTAYTWQQMLDSIWNEVLATDLTGVFGTSPSLPYSPDSTPESFVFPGAMAWRAYNDTLLKLGCAFCFDHTKAPSNGRKLVQIGAADAALATAETARSKDRLEDDDPIESVVSKMPEKLYVAFHVVNKHAGTEKTTTHTSSQWSTGQVHLELVSIGGGGRAGTRALVWDDMPYIVNAAGTAQNASDVSTRASARAANFLRMVKTGGDWQRRAYRGILSEFQPGKKLTGVCWRDTGHGYQTEIVRYPPPLYVDNSGKFVNVLGQSLERLEMPDIGRRTFPIYPITDQFVNVTSTDLNAAGYMDGNVQIYDPDAGWVSVEAINVLNAN